MSVVAIVGRPNVGKSTLFNRLAGRRLAIVEGVPGVTRDRNYAEVQWDERRFLLIDTGGLEADPADELSRDTCAQARQALAEADVILFVVDAHEGLLPADLEIARDLRRRAKDVLVVVNKVDGPRWEGGVYDAYAAGFDQVFPVSAEHNLGLSELREAMEARIPAGVPEPAADAAAVVRVAILGRPNVGKSSLVNQLVGEQRSVVSASGGTTRDAVDTRVTAAERTYLLIDTAGIRRRSRVEPTVERWSVLRALRAIDRAQVCVVLIDAAEGYTDQDARVINLALKGGRGVVLGLNKWDLVPKDGKTFDHAVRELRGRLGPHGHVPILSLSALTGQRMSRVFEYVDQVYAEWTKRVPTAAVNDVLERAVRANPPAVVGRKRARIYYMTQVESGPPRFAAFASNPEGIAESYRRYLVNTLRAAFGFAGVPISVDYRRRSRPRE